MTESTDTHVTPVSEVGFEALRALFEPLGLSIVEVATDAAIPGTFWGEPEAGLIGDQLFARLDTPVHSVLHEACHWLCMDPERRQQLQRDAGGSDTEEHAVCYLQCLLADQVLGYSQARCFSDMEAWGYTFVLGSARAFFEADSEDAQAYLRQAGLLERFTPAPAQR